MNGREIRGRNLCSSLVLDRLFSETVLSVFRFVSGLGVFPVNLLYLRNVLLLKFLFIGIMQVFLSYIINRFFFSFVLWYFSLSPFLPLREFQFWYCCFYFLSRFSTLYFNSFRGSFNPPTPFP